MPVIYKKLLALRKELTISFRNDRFFMGNNPDAFEIGFAWIFAQFCWLISLVLIPLWGPVYLVGLAVKVSEKPKEEEDEKRTKPPYSIRFKDDGDSNTRV
jgi:hypothetical protein